MPSARTIVEDSDEDEDVLSPVKDAEPARSADDADQLKRDRREAHSALFENEASRGHGISGGDITTHLEPPTARTKRRRTTDDTGSSALPLVQQKRSKSATVYGRSRLTDKSGKAARPELSGTRSEGLIRDKSSIDISGQVVYSAPHKSSHEQQLQDDAAAAWNMRGSMLQDFARHEPVTMFASNANTGSTVPDNTYTQQRLIRDALNANEQPYCASIHSPTLQSDGSLRSSAFRTTQATNKSPPACKSLDSTKDGTNSQLLQGKSSPLKQTSKAKSQESMPPSIHSCTPSKCTRPSQLVQPSPWPGPTITTSPKLRSTTPLGTPPAKALSTPEANEVGLNLLARPSTQEDTFNIKRSHSADQSRNPADVTNSVAKVAGSPTLNMKEEIVIAAPAPTLVKKKGRKNEVEALELLNSAQTCSDDLDPDEIVAIGLPEERYKPRPSRSRSAQVVSVAPRDLSVDPGTTSKQRTKRRKTGDTDDISLRANESLETHKVEIISSMGFTPTRAKKALTASKGDLEAAVDNLIERQPSRIEQDTTEIDTAKAHSPPRQTWVTSAERTSPGAEQLQIPTARKTIVSVQIPLAKSMRSKSNQPLFVHEDNLQASSTSESDGDGDDGNQQQVPTATKQPPDGLPQIKRGPGRPRRKAIDVLTEDEAAEMEARGYLHDALGDDERGDVEHLQQPEPIKRGRGRPRSTNAKKDPLKIHHDECSASQQEPEDTKEASTVSCDKPVLQELDTNRTAAATSAPRGHEGIARTPYNEQKNTQTVTPASSPLQPAPPSIPPITPTKQKAVGTQHSPISKGKVPYRVGLSRHARIPSLLRSMKK